MISVDEIKTYLPKYLSPESEKKLFDELKAFPDNLDDRLYTNYLKQNHTVYQGDGIQRLLFAKLPEKEINEVPALILSNTCDISGENPRFQSLNIVYSPIFSLEKYKNALLNNGIDQDKVHDHITSIQKQRITSIFFLPKCGSLKNDSLIFFDRISCCDIDYLSKADLTKVRLFTLSQYGHYLFIFKLSMHFTRVTEGIDRKMS